jgi:hypothetical protein
MLQKFSLLLIFLLSLTFSSCFKDDKIKPIITLKGRSILTIPVGSDYIEPGFVAKDDRDGDISYLVRRSEIPKTDSAGVFLIFYNVTDASGNESTEVIRKVIVTHTATTISGIYKAFGGCNYHSVNNDNYFISAEAESPESNALHLIGLNKLSSENFLHARVLGNTGQDIFIPSQIINDTVYFGFGSVSATSRDMSITVIKTFSNTFRDSCTTHLSKYIQ